jgi:hypothetical protein
MWLCPLTVPVSAKWCRYREVRQSIIDMSTMFNLLNQESKVRDDPNAPALPPCPGKGGFSVRVNVRDVLHSHSRLLRPAEPLVQRVSSPRLSLIMSPLVTVEERTFLTGSLWWFLEAPRSPSLAPVEAGVSAVLIARTAKRTERWKNR